MIKQIFYIIDRRQKRNILILFLMMLIGSGIELLSIAGITPVVAIITDEYVIDTEPVYQWLGKVFHLTDSRQYVLFLSIFLLIIYIVKNVYIILEKQIQYRFVYNCQRKLAKELLSYYINKEYLFHTSTNVADLHRNIETDVIRFWDVILNMLEFLMEALVCLALAIYLFFSDWQSTLAIVFVLFVFIGVFFKVYRKYSVALGAGCRNWRGLMTKYILQAFAGIKEVKVSNKEDFFIKSYDEAFEQYAIVQRKQSVLTILPKPSMEAICVSGLLLVMAVRIFWGTDMKEFVPILSIFVVSAYRMMPSFNRISACYGGIMFGRASVNNIYSDIKEMRQRQTQQRNVENDDFDFRFYTDIELRHIVFSYPESERVVLDDISFTIPRQKSVALVGASGAGKSTLADLILGILQPQKGVVFVDHVNIYDHVRSWHRQIGYIPQMIYLLDDTIRNNVAFGIDPDDIDDQKIWDALKEAQIDEFVRSLPDGLDTEVGDRGVRLSGGQRQRIGIARALYPEPELLVLDEATSALDTETETAVMQAIDRLHGSRTLIIIAHRLTTIRNCDLVYEVMDGKVKLKEKGENYE